ncbi:hypothetical protein LX81_03025 [Palleronia aestuarii]|uniref:Uncharacterized protein n=1 Tax=Palleronia aestuarii TaxID=568105 RepID=A0A2W7NM27_9RHOB|nr:hypothetical protein [Palleronia aestuarii]PZX14226.1 hypothetical protein LX81_03025 [Palleronia aestuarii]
MTLADWLAMAFAIRRRRISAARYAAEARHLRAFPVDEIDVELDVPLLEHVLAVLMGPPHHHPTGFERPHRGARGTAPQTPIIVALANRVARLRAAGVGGNLPASD